MLLMTATCRVVAFNLRFHFCDGAIHNDSLCEAILCHTISPATVKIHVVEPKKKRNLLPCLVSLCHGPPERTRAVLYLSPCHGSGFCSHTTYPSSLWMLGRYPPPQNPHIRELDDLLLGTRSLNKTFSMPTKVRRNV